MLFQFCEEGKVKVVTPKMLKNKINEHLNGSKTCRAFDVKYNCSYGSCDGGSYDKPKCKKKNGKHIFTLFTINKSCIIAQCPLSCMISQFPLSCMISRFPLSCIIVTCPLSNIIVNCPLPCIIAQCPKSCILA